MIHTLLSMAPMLVYLLVMGAIVLALAWFAVTYFDGHDEWLFDEDADDEGYGKLLDNNGCGVQFRHRNRKYPCRLSPYHDGSHSYLDLHQNVWLRETENHHDG